jgi:hypothetical protein
MFLHVIWCYYNLSNPPVLLDGLLSPKVPFAMGWKALFIVESYLATGELSLRILTKKESMILHTTIITTGTELCTTRIR